MLEKTKVAIKNGQSRDTGNVRETRMCNQEWTIDRHQQHWPHNTHENRIFIFSNIIINIDIYTKC